MMLRLQKCRIEILLPWLRKLNAVMSTIMKMTIRQLRAIAPNRSCFCRAVSCQTGDSGTRNQMKGRSRTGIAPRMNMTRQPMVEKSTAKTAAAVRYPTA
jgi:hypothetical protein